MPETVDGRTERLLGVLRCEWRRIATAATFLTRLPLARWGRGDGETLVASVRWFPLVGVMVALAVGAASGVVAALATPGLGVVAGLTVGVLVTGAFHEDGLADVADAAGAFEATRRLEIMRDSRVGTYGALALMLLLGWRAAALWALLGEPLLVMFAALVVAHVLARWSVVFLMSREPYARATGTNRQVADGVDARRYAEASGVAAACLAIPALALPVLMLAWPVTWLVAYAGGRYFRHTLGGLTGDALGATAVVAEVSVLTLAVTWLGP